MARPGYKNAPRVFVVAATNSKTTLRMNRYRRPRDNRRRTSGATHLSRAEPLLTGTYGRRQRGDIVGAVLEPEPRLSPDSVAVAAQVGR